MKALQLIARCVALPLLWALALFVFCVDGARERRLKNKLGPGYEGQLED